MKTIITRLYPNGELRVRSRGKRVPTQKTERSPSERLRHPDSKSLKSSGLDYRSEFQEPKIQSLIKKLSGGGKFSPGWGMTPRRTHFGLRGRRKIMRSGGVLDGLPGCRAAMTFTLPGSGMAAYQTMADYSGYIANRLKTWLYDQMPKGSPVLWFFVWELQKRGALHIHLCVHCEGMREYYKLKRKAKDAWIIILESVESRTGIPMFLSPKGFDWRRKRKKIQVDVQKVRHTVGAYFAKYCSKGSDQAEKHIERGLRPSRWWGCSRQLSRLLLASVLTFTSAEIPQSQADEIVKSTYDRCDADSVTYLNACYYTDAVEIISFPGVELGKEIIEEMARKGAFPKACKLQKPREGSMDVREFKRQLRQMWNSNEGRLRLAEVVGTDTPEWEIFCRAILCPNDIPDESFLALKSILENEGAPENPTQPVEDQFEIQADISDLRIDAVDRD